MFSTLYNLSLVRWSHIFINQLSADMTDHAYTRLLSKTAMADGSFVPLLIRLEHVIEHNVAIESLIESKRIFIDQVDHIAEQTKSTLDLTRAQDSDVVKTKGVLLVGSTMTDQGPSLSDEDIPSDVQELIDSFSSQTVFTKNACRIIVGVRSGIS